jgi:RNA recognition motif-containing protein
MRPQYFRGNVFVANLPPDFDDEQLAEAFDAFGIVLSAHVARDPETGKKLRYGFVDIATERAAKQAVAKMNRTALDGHTIDVRISERPATGKKPARPMAAARRPAAEHPPRRRLALGNATENDSAPSYYLPQPRKQPSFQVERRPLPRRISPP